MDVKSISEFLEKAKAADDNDAIKVFKKYCLELVPDKTEVSPITVLATTTQSLKQQEEKCNKLCKKVTRLAQCVVKASDVYIEESTKLERMRLAYSEAQQKYNVVVKGATAAREAESTSNVDFEALKTIDSTLAQKLENLKASYAEVVQQGREAVQKAAAARAASQAAPQQTSIVPVEPMDVSSGA